MIFGRRRTHEDRLAHAHHETTKWRHRAEHAERHVANLRKLNGQYLTERNEAVARLRELAADRANRSAS